MTESGDAHFVPITEEQRPVEGDPLPQDLYVLLPKAGKYIRLAIAGDIWDQSRADMLSKHSDPQIYIKSDDPQLTDTEINKIVVDEIKKESNPVSEEILRFNSDLAEDVQEIFRFMADPDSGDPAQTLSAMEMISDKILDKVAPDVENLRDVLMGDAKYIHIMSDTSAITSLAIFVAMSHGFTSRKVYRDISLAVLLMDAPLADLDPGAVMKNYANSDDLSEEEKAKIKKHPQVAHDTVQQHLPGVHSTIRQMILNHHELYNGKGYPRGIRSETLPPINRSLALAVDLFEVMKREHLDGMEIDIPMALEVLKEDDVEAHLRRHNRKFVTDTYNFATTVSEE